MFLITLNIKKMFELPATAVADVFTQATAFISETWVLVAVAIGIALGFTVLMKAKTLFVGRSR